MASEALGTIAEVLTGQPEEAASLRKLAGFAVNVATVAGVAFYLNEWGRHLPRPWEK